MNRELAAFLADDARPQGTMILPELYGFLFTVCASPEPIPVPEWMPMIFNDQDPGYVDDEAGIEVTGWIIEAYNEVNDQVLSGAPGLPEWCPLQEPPMDNFGDEAPLRHWAQGFTVGHEWLGDLWDEYVKESEEVESCAMVLSFFASEALAATYVEVFWEDAEDAKLSNAAETVADNFADALNSYCRMSLAVRRVFEQSGRETFIRETPKVGRNDPCPCGSGKKFKKCCLH